MKKILCLLCIVLLAFGTLVGCSQPANSESETQKSGQEDKLKIALLIPGNLGDKSFFDSANNGILAVKEQLGAEVKVVEMSMDNTKWQPTLIDFSEQDYDLIVTGSSSIDEILTEVALEYPDKRYISFDSPNEPGAPNIYTMHTKTNELSFMAGVVAAIKAEELGETTLGFIGGMDIPGINEFLVGYIEGAQYINENMRVSYAYAGGFNDAAKAKEQALVMYNSGISIIYQAAGQSGLGVVDAAKDLNKFTIGVDSDQAKGLVDSDRAKAERIITSAIKNIDIMIVNAIKQHLDGTLPYGTREVLGLKEQGVGVAKNEFYEMHLTKEQRAIVDEVEQKVVSGEIEVTYTATMSTEELDAIRMAARP